MLNYILREPKSAVSSPSLILLIHGYGSNEEDLFSFAEELPDDAYIVSVRAPLALSTGGYAWYELDFSQGIEKVDNNQAIESQKMILDFIEKLKEVYSINPDEISLVGFSQGSILSFSLAMKNPGVFKQVACLSGYPDIDLFKEVDILSNDYSSTAFYFSHGVEDPVIPIEWAREFENLAEELNFNYDYKEYNQGHGINTTNYYDLLNFLQ